MIGGMVSTTVLTLLVIPVIYALWRASEVKRLQQVSSTMEMEKAD